MKFKLSRKRVVAAATAAVSVAGLGLVAAAPAQASSATYSISDPCGSSYYPVDSFSVGYHSIDGSYVLLGTAYLTYSDATGDNCAYLVKNGYLAQSNFWGYGTYMYLRLDACHNNDSWDVGNYGRYAGPVYVDGRYAVKVVAGVGLSPNSADAWTSTGWVDGGNGGWACVN